MLTSCIEGARIKFRQGRALTKALDQVGIGYVWPTERYGRSTSVGDKLIRLPEVVAVIND